VTAPRTWSAKLAAEACIEQPRRATHRHLDDHWPRFKTARSDIDLGRKITQLPLRSNRSGPERGDRMDLLCPQKALPPNRPAMLTQPDLLKPTRTFPSDRIRIATIGFGGMGMGDTKYALSFRA